MAKWIDLKDPSGARLKMAEIDVRGQAALHIFVTNLGFLNPKWRQCVSELAFREAPSRKYLVRRVEPNERLALADFRKVFPSAVSAQMEPSAFMLSLGARSPRTAQDDTEDVGVELKGVVKIGRNAAGLQVYDSLSGRFYVDEATGARTMEASAAPLDFLRLSPPGQPLPQGNDLDSALLATARGFIVSMDRGEVQRTEDYKAFRAGLFTPELQTGFDQQAIDDLLSRAIDGALLRFVRDRHEVAGESYLPMARLYDYLPPHQGAPRGAGVVPQPLNVAAQRLLGDTVGKTVLVPNAFDGASFAFLPATTRIKAFRGLHEVRERFDGFAVEHPGVQWLGRYLPAGEQNVDALFFNADPVRDERGARQDFTDVLRSLRSLAPGGRAILVLSADGQAPGRISSESASFVRALAARVSIEDVFETAPILSQKAGGVHGLRVFSLRNVSHEDPAQIEALINAGVRVLSSWDAIKTHVDETINALQVAEAKAAEEAIDAQGAAVLENYQRPYIAFSRVGEARTMLPANMQSSAQAYLTRVEQLYGPIDDFVGEQLGMGFSTLQSNFSPEQVDGLAVMISRQLIGRSSVLADDTGIGKGRQLAGLATWANKRGSTVVFITDRSNLFSDLARDLKHIGEWERFRPLVMNVDGEITFEESPGAEPVVLAKGVSNSTMSAIMEGGQGVADLQVNIVFLTYSQIATQESAKALWLKNQIGNALVIADEAHIAAGSDSQVAQQIAEIASLAKHVQFASATWAKSYTNMHIYQRAFPASVSVTSLSETMRKGGESFAEIFSGMLAHDGALIRREHDLSKLEVEMLIDEERRQRNERVSDLVADVLGAASYINGDMQQVFIRTNADSVRLLTAARVVRASAAKPSAKLFGSAFGAGSVIYEVMKGVQGSLNAEFVADLAVQSLRDGFKPVIVSDATGERLLDEMIEAEAARMASEGLTGAVVSVPMPTLRDLLRRVILRNLSTIRVAEVTADDVLDADLVELQADQQGELPVMEGAAQEGEGAAAPGAVLGDQAPADGAPQAQSAPAEDEGVDVAQTYAQAANAADGEAPGRRDLAAAEDEDFDQDRPARKKSRIKYIDVPIAELPDLPQAARERFQAGMQELEEKIMAVPAVPVLCVDVIAQRLRDAGFTVGEITGRKKRLIRDESGSGWLISPRASSKKAVKSVIRAFNNGGLSAVIMNRSGATGTSMHASPRFLDQSRRRLIEHQIPENPVDRIQLLGRVNRFDQLSSPLLTTASTGIFGEVRYLMMQNIKLARMSANVRSSRDNAMSLKSIRDMFNVVGKEAVVDYLNDSPLVAKRLGLSTNDIEMSPDIVNKMTMRIPLLKVAQQEVVYSEIYNRMDEILLRAELDGVNPLKPGEIDLRASVLRESIFFGEESAASDPFASAFDEPVVARKISWSRDHSPMSIGAVEAVCQVNLERLIQAGLAKFDAGSALPAPLTQPDTDQDAVEALRALGADQAGDLGGGQGAVGAVVPPVPVSSPRLSADLLIKVLQGFHGLARLSHLSSEIESFDQAVIENQAVKRAFIKWKWLDRNLPKLVPGRRLLSNRLVEGALFGESQLRVIVDVRVPDTDEHLLDLGRWHVSVVSPGDEKPKILTLRSIFSDVSCDVSKGEISGDLLFSFRGSYVAEGLHFPSVKSFMVNSFDLMRRGRHSETGLVLTGNMYLAAEWAAATKTGRTIIYTDEAGQRHRAIGLPKDMTLVDPEFLPLRVADAQAQRKLLLPIMLGLDVEHVSDQAAAPREPVALDTTFKSALAGIERTFSRSSVLVIDPGSSLAITCTQEDLRRLRAAMSSGQKSIRFAEVGRGTRAADDPAHVQVSVYSTTRRARSESAQFPLAVNTALSLVGSRLDSGEIFSDYGGAKKMINRAVIYLRFAGEQQAARALKLLRDYAGLEIYASTGALREAAKDALRQAALDRREQMRLAQIQGLQSLRAETLTETLTDPAAHVAHPEPDEVASDTEINHQNTPSLVSSV